MMKDNDPSFEAFAISVTIGVILSVAYYLYETFWL